MHAKHSPKGPGIPVISTSPSQDLVQEVKVISESLTCVELPPDCIVSKSAQGIPKDANLARSMAIGSTKYVESSLKLAKSLLESSRTPGEDDLDKFATITYRHMKYIQEKLAQLTGMSLMSNVLLSLERI